MYHFPPHSNLNSYSSILHLYCLCGPWKLQLTSLQWWSFVFLALNIKGSLVWVSGIRTDTNVFIGLQPDFLGAPLRWIGFYIRSSSVIPLRWTQYGIVFICPKVQIILEKHQGNSREITYLHPFSALTAENSLVSHQLIIVIKGAGDYSFFAISPSRSA